MSKIVFNDRVVSDNNKVFIIAEACDNHFGDLKIAKEMCKLSKLAGADCIKFQHHLPDEEMLRDIPMSSNMEIPLYDFLLKYALKLDDHIQLKKYCDELGIIYLCTPFSLKAAQELNSIGVCGFKIGSGEMTDIPTIVEISKFGKPMILSTGMSTLDEIKRTYQIMCESGIDFAFTNCISEYPPDYSDINLEFINVMKEQFPKAIIGHSDHTPDLYTSFAAVALGAKIIEKHVIIDKKIKGPDQSVSIDFNDLYHLVDGIRKIELGLGNEKFIHKNEEQIRAWAFRSIVSKKKLHKGEIISQDMIWSKRPGTGIPSYKMNEIIGKKLLNDVDENVLLKYEDFE